MTVNILKNEDLKDFIERVILIKPGMNANIDEVNDYYHDIGKIIQLARKTAEITVADQEKLTELLDLQEKNFTPMSELPTRLKIFNFLTEKSCLLVNIVSFGFIKMPSQFQENKEYIASSKTLKEAITEIEHLYLTLSETHPWMEHGFDKDSKEGETLWKQKGKKMGEDNDKETNADIQQTPKEDPKSSDDTPPHDSQATAEPTPEPVRDDAPTQTKQTVETTPKPTVESSVDSAEDDLPPEAEEPTPEPVRDAPTQATSDIPMPEPVQTNIHDDL